MTAPGPLTLEDLERLDGKAREFYRLGLTHGGMGDDVLRLTTALRSVMAERDALNGHLNAALRGLRDEQLARAVLKARVLDLRSMCDRVREARNAYPILHHDTCDHWTAPEPPNCTCGAWALRAAIEDLGPGGGP